MLDEGEVRAFIFSTCCGSKTQICGKLYKDGASDIFACKIFLWILYTYTIIKNRFLCCPVVPVLRFASIDFKVKSIEA